MFCCCCCFVFFPQKSLCIFHQGVIFHLEHTLFLSAYLIVQEGKESVKLQLTTVIALLQVIVELLVVLGVLLLVYGPSLQ